MIDLTAFWAGPFATGLLAAVGAALIALMLNTWPGRLITIAALIYFLIKLFRKFRKKRGKPMAPAVLACNQLLTKMDRRAGKRGLVRRSNETIRQFAERIEEAETDHAWRATAAAWYHSYSAIRFSCPDDVSIRNRLKRELDEAH